MINKIKTKLQKFETSTKSVFRSMLKDTKDKFKLVGIDRLLHPHDKDALHRKGSFYRIEKRGKKMTRR